MPASKTRALLSAALATALLAACGGESVTTTTTEAETSTTAAPATTSTAPDTTTTEPSTTTAPSTTTTAGVASDEAREMIARIVEAAEAGDLDRLAELALAGDATFTASFGIDPASPEELASYWEEREAEGEPIAETIATLFQMPMFVTLSETPAGEPLEIYVAPTAMSEDADESDRKALEEALGAERVESWFVDGTYLGYRVGIDENGDWLFFVAGD